MGIPIYAIADISAHDVSVPMLRVTRDIESWQYKNIAARGACDSERFCAAESLPADFLGLLAGDAAADPAALLRVQDRLAEPDRGWSHLDALVLGAELERLLQAEDPRRDQPLKFLTSGLADVGDLLLLGDVHVHVVAARVLADDHALVDLGARRHEQRAALLEVEHGVAGGGT